MVAFWADALPRISKPVQPVVSERARAAWSPGWTTTTASGATQLCVVVSQEAVPATLFVDLADIATDELGCTEIVFVIQRDAARGVCRQVHQILNGRLFHQERFGTFDTFDWVFMHCEL